VPAEVLRLLVTSSIATSYDGYRFLATPPEEIR
jgi:hypothetical protein